MRPYNARMLIGPYRIEPQVILAPMAGVTDKPFRLPVQWVNRPNLDFRGFSGLIATGSVKRGSRYRR